MAYLVLFDSSFQPLGSPEEGDVSSVHTCKSWSLKRKAFEFDEFTAVCRGYKDSKNATYVGLFDNDGSLIYMCLSGIPTTKDGLTTVNGIDVRQIFNQEIPVDYSKAVDSSGFTSEYEIYKLLLQDSLKDLAGGVSLSGISYSVNALDTSHKKEDNEGGKIVSGTKEIRNVWDQIQAVNAVYSNTVLAEWKNDSETNAFLLTFRVCPIFDVYTIRRKDFDIRRTMNQSVVNHTSVWSSDLSEKLNEYFLLKSPERTEDENGRKKLKYITEKFSGNVMLPIRSKAFARAEVTVSSNSENAQQEEEDEYEKNLTEAREEARQELLDSISKDRVTIDLNSRYGAMLKDRKLSDLALLSGYYSADGEGGEDRYLPVSAISTDSSGSCKIEFGRLSEYWFLD